MDRPRERILVQCQPPTNLEWTGMYANTYLCYQYQGPVCNPGSSSRTPVRRVSQLAGRLAGNGCSLRHKFPHQEIRRWHEGGVGMLARRVGNILQAFICVSRVAPVMEMDSCFTEILVWVDGSVQFIDIKTLVLKGHGVQKPCINFLPLTVQAVEINHLVTAVKSPPMVKHWEGEIYKAPIS